MMSMECGQIMRKRQKFVVTAIFLALGVGAVQAAGL